MFKSLQAQFPDLRLLLRSTVTSFFSPRFSPSACLLPWRGAGALGELSSCRMLRGERPVPPDVVMILLLVLRLTGLLPEEKPGPARRPGRAGAALGEGGLSASSPGATAGGELRRAGSSTTGSSSGLAGPGSWAAASAPKTSLSCLTRRSRLSLDTALLGVWETPGVGDRGSWACLLPATGSAAPG